MKSRLPAVAAALTVLTGSITLLPLLLVMATLPRPAFGMVLTHEPGVPVRQDAQSPASVSGEVELGKLKVPPGVTPSVSGGGEEFREIEKFIAERNAKLKDMEEKEETR
ncbi:MAG: hypothetical protein Q8Q12_04445 [bacterium]|nr:hypothetical protein [bacterium]